VIARGEGDPAEGALRPGDGERELGVPPEREGVRRQAPGLLQVAGQAMGVGQRCRELGNGLGVVELPAARSPR
jgi:hypothetical protein